MSTNRDRNDAITLVSVVPTLRATKVPSLGTKEEAKTLQAVNRAKSRRVYHQAPEQLRVRTHTQNLIRQEESEVFEENKFQPTVKLNLNIDTEHLDPEAEAQSRLEGREQTLLSAMEVLGLGEGFRPITATFLTKLHSNSSSSSDSGSFHPVVKLNSNSGTRSTSYSYSDILSSSDTASITLPPIGVGEAPLKVLFPDPPRQRQLESCSQSSHAETQFDLSVGHHSNISAGSILSSIHTFSQNFESPPSKLETVATETVTKEGTLSNVTYSQKSEIKSFNPATTKIKNLVISAAVPKKLTTKVPTSATVTRKKTQSTESVPISDYSRSYMSEVISESSTFSSKDSKNEHSSSKSVTKSASSSSVLNTRASIHASKRINKNMPQKVGDSEFFKSYSKSKDAFFHHSQSQLNLPSCLPKNSNSGFSQQPPSPTSISPPSILSTHKSHLIPQSDHSAQKSTQSTHASQRAESESGMKSLSDQRIHISYPSSSTKSYTAKSVPKVTESLTSVSHPSKIVENKIKSHDHSEKKSTSRCIQSPTPTYSNDFFSEEGEKYKESVSPSPSFTHTHKSPAGRQKSKKIFKPPKVHQATSKEKKTRDDSGDTTPHSSKSRQLSSPISWKFKHEVYRVTSDLSHPVASLVTHCVAVNDEIYRHALSFAKDVEKKYKAGH